MPISQRPREKALSVGFANLSNAELIAILLGTGNGKHSVLDLAKIILKKHPLDTWTEKLPQNLGPAKTIQVGAALEIGRRIFALPQLDKVLVRNNTESLSQLADIASKKQEYLVALYLNARQELIKKEIISIGNLNSNLVQPRDILAPALQLPCQSVILAHNHPSGDPHPSENDIKFTARLQKACEALGIILIDHLIICSKNYFSFAENKVDSVGFAPTSPSTLR